jgi:hypothetical protein
VRFTGEKAKRNRERERKDPETMWRVLSSWMNREWGKLRSRREWIWTDHGLEDYFFFIHRSQSFISTFGGIKAAALYNVREP